MNNRKAFTLVELIIIIAIIAILAAMTFVAIDPARRVHEANNAKRSSDVETILDALKKHQTDNDGNLLASLSGLTAGQPYVIGTDTSNCDLNCTAKTTPAACVDIAALPQNYLASIPIDPVSGSAGNSDYYLTVTALGNLIIGACDPEGEGPGGSGVEAGEAPYCRGRQATIYVNGSNIIVGGPDDGETYGGSLDGTSGSDVIVGTSGTDNIDADNGDDVICGRDSIDFINGDDGNDEIYGDDGSDFIGGDDGNDKLYGGSGLDNIDGDDGDDVVCGGDDIDLLEGNDNDDKIDGGSSFDTANGGSGTDICINSEIDISCEDESTPVPECFDDEIDFTGLPTIEVQR